MTIAETIAALARRVQSNVPRHQDPERFHVEKDEIAHELRRIAEQVATHEP